VQGIRHWTAWTVAAAWLVGVAAVVLAARPEASAVPERILTVVVGLVPLILSVVLARRAPGHPAGPLVAVSGSILLVELLLVFVPFGITGVALLGASRRSAGHP
jgi:FtsH-binding integral membrane protein